MVRMNWHLLQYKYDLKLILIDIHTKSLVRMNWHMAPSVHEVLESSCQPSAYKFHSHIVVPANHHLSIDPNNYAETGICMHPDLVSDDSPFIPH